MSDPVTRETPDEECELPKGWVKSTVGVCCDIHDAIRVPVNSTQRNARIAGKPKSDLFPYYGATGQVGFIDGFLFDGEFVLIGEDGAPFLDPLKAKAYIARGRFWVNNHAHIITLQRSSI